MSPEQLQRQRLRNINPSKHTEPREVVQSDIRTVAVVGLGYVGLPLAIRSAARGFTVIGFDIDDVKIAQLEKREANFLTEEESSAFKGARALFVTSDETDLRSVDAFIICVPTPVHHDHSPDLGPLEGAAAAVGRHLTAGALVVIESTVSPGVCENVALPILEAASGLSRGDFYFAHCPERINPGDDTWDIRSIPRVIGGRNPESLSRAIDLYKHIVDAELIAMQSIKEAEAVKMVENSFRDINIAFVNELAMAFDKAGIDIVNVIRGASTKPFGFMAHYPGCGVGGHCIPVDPYYLIRYGKENGFEHQFLMTARRINSRMPRYAVSLLSDTFRERGQKLQGATVALLGLAYKRDIPDVRESPALDIRELLIQGGARVRTFDPYVAGAGRDIRSEIQGADAVIIATDHAECRALSPADFQSAGVPIVIDGRNCLDKDAFASSGILYRGIGRRSTL